MARIRGLLSKQDLKKLINSFISCRVDICKSFLSGLFPKKPLDNFISFRTLQSDLLQEPTELSKSLLHFYTPTYIKKRFQSTAAACI